MCFVSLQVDVHNSTMNMCTFRNNMTILDTVVVQGQGGRGEMKFGNKKSVLTFEMTEKHLKSCDSEFYLFISPSTAPMDGQGLGGGTDRGQHAN